MVGRDKCRRLDPLQCLTMIGSLLVLVIGARVVSAVDPTAIELRPGVHLFVDDHLLDEMSQVWRTLHRPRKHPNNPLVTPDRPWEGYLVMQPGTVICECSGTIA